MLANIVPIWVNYAFHVLWMCLFVLFYLYLFALYFFLLIGNKRPSSKRLLKEQTDLEVHRLRWLTNLLNKFPCPSSLECEIIVSLIWDPHPGREQYINTTCLSVYYMNSTTGEGFEPLPSWVIPLGYPMVDIYTKFWISFCLLILKNPIIHAPWNIP